MTVTSKKAHPVLSALQSLLQPEDTSTEPSIRATTLASKVTTAVSVLSSSPSLHSLALEVVSNGLLYQYSQYEHTGKFNSFESGIQTLSSALDSAFTLLDSMLTYCPQGWSSRLFKWSVTLFGRLSTTYGSPSGVEDAMRLWLTHPLLIPLHSFINKATKFLVESGHGDECMEILFPICSSHAPNLNWLLTHVVSQNPSHLMPLLLEYALSLHIPRTPSSDPGFTTLTQALHHLSRTHSDTLKGCVLHTLNELLQRNQDRVTASRNSDKLIMLIRVATHCQPLLDITAKECLAIVTPSRIQAMFANGDKTLSSSTKVSHDSHVIKPDDEDIDEGEILSDEEEMEGEKEAIEQPKIRVEEMVSLVSELVCLLRGDEACTALNSIMDTYIKMKLYLKTQEEAIEEGEIVRESPVELVVDGCRGVMGEVLSRLHSSACVPHLTPGQGEGVVGGSGLELAVGLQSGVKEWCDRLLLLCQQNDRDIVCLNWLQELISCVCICSSELQAAQAIAHLICNSSSTHQLSVVMEIYWELQVRHPHLARTTTQVSMATIQQKLSLKKVDPEIDTLVENYCSNMLSVLQEGPKGNNSRLKSTRTHFLTALSEQALPLMQLLDSTLPQAGRHFVSLFDLLCCVFEEGVGGCNRGSSVGMSLQSLSRVTQSLLTHFFAIMKMIALTTAETGQSDLSLEISLGRCKRLIGWCTSFSGSDPSVDQSAVTRMVAFTAIVEAVLSKEMSWLFSTTKLSQCVSSCVSSTPSLSDHTPSQLFTANRHLGLSNSYGPKFNTRQIQHSGSLHQRHHRKQNNKDAEYLQLSVSSTMNHLAQLLKAVGMSSSCSCEVINQELASVVLDHVAPHAPVEMKKWPDEETLKYNLEWDLAVKRRFDDNPVLWHLMLFISDGGRGHGSTSGLAVCVSVVRTLLTVLIQHWQRCRANKTTAFRRELESSVSLMECLAKSQWLVEPLSSVGELFPLISPLEVSLLLTAVNTHLSQTTPFKPGSSGNYGNKEHLSLVKSVLRKNIHHFGGLYGRYTRQAAATASD